MLEKKNKKKLGCLVVLVDSDIHLISGVLGLVIITLSNYYFMDTSKDSVELIIIMIVVGVTFCYKQV